MTPTASSLFLKWLAGYVVVWEEVGGGRGRFGMCRMLMVRSGLYSSSARWGLILRLHPQLKWGVIKLLIRLQRFLFNRESVVMTISDQYTNIVCDKKKLFPVCLILRLD